MYCQSKQIERRPSPSLPFEPPKMRVKSWDLGLARQNIENPVRISAGIQHYRKYYLPVRRGKIHSGNISQIKMLLGPMLVRLSGQRRCERTQRMQYRTVSASSLHLPHLCARQVYMNNDHGGPGKHPLMHQTLKPTATH